MNVKMGLLKAIGKMLVIGTVGSTLLLGCGGGGGGSASNNGVYIAGWVTLYPAPTSSYVPVVIVQTESAVPITIATVTINGVALPLNTNNSYSTVNAVVPDGSGNFNLTVTVNGTTYTATEKAFTTLPVVTVPPFTATAVNTISWTAPAGAPPPGSNMFYYLLIENQNTLASVYSSGYISALSDNIPAGTTQAGTGYFASVIGYRMGSQIAGAMRGSSLNISAMSQQTSFNAL